MRKALTANDPFRIDENLLLTACGYIFCTMSLIALFGWFTLYFVSPIRMFGA